MEPSHADIVRKLVDAFSRLTPQLQLAARYLLDHPEEVALNSMRWVASEAGIKPATMTRLTKALGFTDYHQLREPFRQRLRNAGPGYSARFRDVQRRGSDDMRALFEEVRSQDLENIRSTLADDKYPNLIEAVETLWSSQQVYVMGLRGSYAPAFLFHYSYQLFRDNSLLLDTGAGILADQLRNIGPKDSMLVMSISPYTQLTIAAANYAAEVGASVIAICDSDVSPTAQIATHTIVTHHQSPSFYQSFTATLSLTQALITLLVSRSGGNALKTIKQAEQQLSRINAYWVNQ